MYRASDSSSQLDYARVISTPIIIIIIIIIIMFDKACTDLFLKYACLDIVCVPFYRAKCKKTVLLRAPADDPMRGYSKDICFIFYVRKQESQAKIQC